MGNIKNIIFDFGGVIIPLDFQQAINRFKEKGLKDAEEWLDPYTQHGLFGDMEMGIISAEDFRIQLSEIIGKTLTYEDCEYALRGYLRELPQRNLTALRQLRLMGIKIILLSNTNPYIMNWAMSMDFDGQEGGVKNYFDSIYLSYECRLMKPDPRIFQLILEKENIVPEETLFVDDGEKNVAAAAQLGINVFCPPNGYDWTQEIMSYL